MSQVSSTRADAPTPATRAAPQGQRPVAPDDVRAMSDAFAAARDKMKFAVPEGLPQQPGQQKPGTQKTGTQKTSGAPLPGAPLAATDRQATEAAANAAFDRKAGERQQSERQADGQGLALPGQPAAPPPAMIAAMPNPQVDPGGFAQMLADLWTRENGKGAREVRVRFGNDAWPATGATLIRNAAGTLDISVSVGAGSVGTAGGPGVAPHLDALGQELNRSGLGVGALEIAYE